MPRGLSEGEVFELGLQEGTRPWQIQAEVGTRHSSRKKQTASQYLWSLPNPQHVVGNGEKLWGCQTQGGSVTPLSLERRRKRQGPQGQRWDSYWLRQCLSSSVCPSLRPSLTPSCSFAGPQSLPVLLLAGNTHFCSCTLFHCPVLSQTHLGNERLQ